MENLLITLSVKKYEESINFIRKEIMPNQEYINYNIEELKQKNKLRNEI